ncbi:MAG: branched-chain amino acid abc transporter, amino acid-binding protein, partial [Hyphomicrobiales bacterium]|nr:branched-chain amino acid abc transporter, amino acid-binding protein [Hyphomicrobiales bacterium]
RGEPAQAISLTRKLIDTDNVLAILGPYFSGESEAAFPVANRASTPIVTPSSAKPGIAAANRPWPFRNASTTDKTDAALVAHWLKRQPAIRKVVIFYDGKDAVSSSDGKAVMPAVLKANNIEVLDSISFQTGDVDFSAQVTRAKALGADGIVVTALFTEAGHLMRELRRQGMQQPILAGVELSLDHKFIETAGGDAAEGVLTGADFNRDSPRPSVVAFVKEYQERVGQLPGNSSALMYDALFLMRHCIMTTGVSGNSAADKTKIRDCWAGLKDVDAPIAGPSSIDENGDARHEPNFLIVKSGKFVVDR